MQGCLAMLVLFVVLAVGEYIALGWTPMSGSIGLPIVSAALISLALTSLWGLGVWRKRKRALARPPTQWRDGDLVGFAGRIASAREPILAPGSGIPCAIYEYSLRVRRTQRSGNERSTSELAAFDGMGMSGCKVRAGAHEFGLIGFPILTGVGKNRLSSAAALERIAAHLLANEVKPKPQIVNVLSALNEVLSDADGVVNHNMECYAAFDLAPYRAQYAEDPAGAVAALTGRLKAEDYFLEEQLVQENMDVTVFGRYRASDRTIDVGSGLKHAEHGLALGSGAAVTSGGMRGTLITAIVFGALALVLHAWIVPALWASAAKERYAGRGIPFDSAIATAFGSRSGRDSLVSYAQSDDARAVALLTRLGADPNRGDPRPLQQAGDFATAKALLDAGADPNRTESNGSTALMRFVERGDLETVQLLLARGAKVDQENEYGNTALSRAAIYGNVEIGRALLAAHADANHRAKDGATPLDEARANGRAEFEELLRSTGEARETEVTERNGTPVQLRDATVRMLEAYQTALHAHDTARIEQLKPSAKGFDWSQTDWEALLGARPVRVEEAIGFANESAATIRVRGPTNDGSPRGLTIGFTLQRDAAGGEFEGWTIAREWIEWGEVQR